MAKKRFKKWIKSQQLWIKSQYASPKVVLTIFFSKKKYAPIQTPLPVGYTNQSGLEAAAATKLKAAAARGYWTNEAGLVLLHKWSTEHIGYCTNIIAPIIQS